MIVGKRYKSSNKTPNKNPGGRYPAGVFFCRYGQGGTILKKGQRDTSPLTKSTRKPTIHCLPNQASPQNCPGDISCCEPLCLPEETRCLEELSREGSPERRP